ncbi:MAG: 16S rRNA (cytosine(1402)-N(4))-methyltransferase RsmH [Nitrospinae bacterium]|nr:16S rRNA (cytosine(1402)-N(4))-methyltransferase RsmH [Nitrospinota bacterium]
MPVLLDEVINFLKCEPRKKPKVLRGEPDNIYVDANLGDGGHAEHILKKSSPTGILIGIDRDEDSIKFASDRLSSYRERVQIFHDNFKNIKNVVRGRAGFSKVDGILFDLGVSTRQLMNAERGFSFSSNAPLDMRMDKSRGVTAKEIVNNFEEEKLRGIIYKYGEEKWAKKITRAIVRERGKMPIETTSQLSDIVVSAIPPVHRSQRIHPATKTFQAIRIAVNGEIEILEDAIRDAIALLNTEGRICVISYHSLEDRIVKNLFREMEHGCICPHDIPKCICGRKGNIKILTKKPVTPSEEEVRRNPRSRSAKLRAAEKVDGLMG